MTMKAKTCIEIILTAHKGPLSNMKRCEYTGNSMKESLYSVNLHVHVLIRPYITSVVRSQILRIPW